MDDRLASGDGVDVARYLVLTGQTGSRIVRVLTTEALGESDGLIEGLFSEALGSLNEWVEAEV